MTRDEREALSQRICNFYIDSSNNSVKTTSGRPYKISDEQLDGLVKSVNNRCGLSQRKLGRRFWVHHSTISRTLRKRTSVVIRKRRKAPKMNSKDQENRARKNCGKMHRKLLSGCDVILDDEKDFKLSGNNVGGNAFFFRLIQLRVL
ncbi:unnamed protein product [Rotaria magnacalcarata]|uniref:Transposase Tc1-like domain-containing protein n=1 Tax=Rotaria magnacalcarata TaxID=392030 RepID=A0A8S3DEP4_9BILA|nr:unnamed protein product [Rotaria magnacalcarata]